MKVREGDAEYWLPVQRILVRPMTSELRPQEKIEVFVIYVGQATAAMCSCSTRSSTMTLILSADDAARGLPRCAPRGLRLVVLSLSASMVLIGVLLVLCREV